MPAIIKASELAPADVAALVELRLKMFIRIDQAGPNAEALHRLTSAGLIMLEDLSCDVTVDQLTDLQRKLGFKARGGFGLKGEQDTWAPTWSWERSAKAIPLLRELEGRQPISVDWETFVAWMLKVWRYHEGPTIAEAAQHFGVSVLDMVDLVDGYRWAYREARDGKPIDQQTIELEGE
jgi:hypothetical protein